jgi:UDP-N-acetylglucosamine--N-acetylmuramyl-(pentapeptide) pyrophosphoryl-undecaprenol N-acetylglucosamine transferase
MEEARRLYHGRRVAIAAGGTAGHVHPALAVADAWRAAVPDLEVVFLGRAGGPEARLVPAAGHRLVPVPAAPLFGVGPWGRVRAAGMLVAGAARARGVLRAEGIGLVLGFGGHASAGAVLGAWSLGLPTAIHEANAVAGVANRLLARVADVVLLGFPEAAPGFPARKVRVVGTPVRAAVAGVVAGRDGAGGALRVLVLGGSEGSPFLNARVPDLLLRLRTPLEVRHVAGRFDPAPIAAAYAAAGIRATVVPYLDDVAGAYRTADVAVTCAGAGTLAELAATRLPALLVPLGSAALDHQSANARAFAAATGLPWVREEAWDPTALAARLAALVGERGRAAARLGAAAAPDAARNVVEACQALLPAR